MESCFIRQKILWIVMAINKAKMKCNEPKRQVQGGKKFAVKACKDGKKRLLDMEMLI